MLDAYSHIDSFISMIFLNIYLPDFDCFSHIVMIGLLMLKLVNKEVYGVRAHQNTWGRVSQA